MDSLTDQQLLRDYAGRRSEAAFAELVQRHLDFVYSAALRMVRDAHLAEDVAQSVFVALAQNAARLTDRPVLSGWLHRMAQTLGTSEDAAQKRVSRAVDRLREGLAKRGVGVGASGLAVAVAGNAVQTALIGLSATITTAAALAGAAIQTAATRTAAKAAAMTTIQKVLSGWKGNSGINPGRR